MRRDLRYLFALAGGLGALLMLAAGCDEKPPPDPKAPDVAKVKAGEQASPQQIDEMRRRHGMSSGSR